MEFLKQKKYPVDKTGRSPDNLIRDERHHLHPEYRIIIPHHAGFFSSSMVVMWNGRDLVKEQHYRFGNLDDEATIEANSEIYREIIFTDDSINGDIYLTYQTFGDPLHPGVLAKYIKEMKERDDEVDWGRIRNKPTRFLPLPHKHHMHDLEGNMPFAYGLTTIAHAIKDLHARMNKQAYAMLMSFNMSVNQRLDGIDASIKSVREMDRRVVEIRDEATALMENFKIELRQGIEDGTIAVAKLTDSDKQALTSSWTQDIAREIAPLTRNFDVVNERIDAIDTKVTELSQRQFEPVRPEGYYLKTSELSDKILEHPKVQKVDELLQEINKRPTLLELNAEISRQAQQTRWENVLNKPNVVIRQPFSRASGADLDTLIEPDIYDVIPPSNLTDRTNKHYPSELSGYVKVSKVNNNTVVFQEYVDFLGNRWSRSKEGDRRFTTWSDHGKVKWDNLTNKPTYFPTRWQDIQGKPVDIEGNTLWQDIEGKPSWMNSFDPTQYLKYTGESISLKANTTLSYPTNSFDNTFKLSGANSFIFDNYSGSPDASSSPMNLVIKSNSNIFRINNGMSWGFVFDVASGDYYFRNVIGEEKRFVTDKDFTWNNLQGKPNFATVDQLNNISWSQITNRPGSFNSDWINVSNKPETALRWPTWNEVSGKPEGLITDKSQLRLNWNQIDDVPAGIGNLGNVVTYATDYGDILRTGNMALHASSRLTLHGNTVVVASRKGDLDIGGDGSLRLTGNWSFYDGNIKFGDELIAKTTDLTWNNVTGKPATFPTNWASISNIPATASRWPNWDEIQNKPSYATRWASWNDISNKPSSFPTTWDSVKNKPASLSWWSDVSPGMFVRKEPTGLVTDEVIFSAIEFHTPSGRMGDYPRIEQDGREGLKIELPSSCRFTFSKADGNLYRYRDSKQEYAVFNDEIKTLADRVSTNTFTSENQFDATTKFLKRTINGATKYVFEIIDNPVGASIINRATNKALMFKENGELHYGDVKLATIDDINSVKATWANIAGKPTNLVTTTQMESLLNTKVTEFRNQADSKFVLKTDIVKLGDGQTITEDKVPTLSKEGNNTLLRVGNMFQLNGNNTYVRVHLDSTNRSWYFDHRVEVPDFKINSDRRIKSNIKKMDNATEKVKQLSGYTFTLNQLDDAPSAGLIAQEVQKVLPEAVSVKEDTNVLSLNYNGVIGLLVETVKEQQARIERLEKALGIRTELDV